MISGASGIWRSSGDTPASLDGLRCENRSIAIPRCCWGTGAAGSVDEVCAPAYGGHKIRKKIKNSLRKKVSRCESQRTLHFHPIFHHKDCTCVTAIEGPGTGRAQARPAPGKTQTRRGLCPSRHRPEAARDSLSQSRYMTTCCSGYSESSHPPFLGVFPGTAENASRGHAGQLFVLRSVII